MVGNVSYSHNVVVSFTAQNAQALVQATQNANRSLADYNRTLQQNVSQLSNVTRATQSYQSSLAGVSTANANMGKSVTNMGNTFNATLNPIRNSGNALNQFTNTANTSGQSFQKWGGFLKNNLANIGMLTAGIAGLDDQYLQLHKAQVAVDRAHKTLATTENRVGDMQRKLNQMVAEGKQGTAEYNALLADFKIAQEGAAVAADRYTVAQETLSERTEDFWVGILPNALLIAGSAGQLISGLGLNMTKLKGIASGVGGAIGGLGGTFATFKKTIGNIDLKALASSFLSIGAPVLLVVGAIWLLVGAYRGLSNVSKDIIEILDLQVTALSPLQIAFLKIQESLSNMNLAPKLTAQQKKDLDFYDKLTGPELDKLKKRAEEKGANLGGSFAKGFTTLPKPVLDVIHGLGDQLGKAFGDIGTDIENDPAIENGLNASVVRPYARLPEQLKDPSQAISNTLTNVLGDQLTETGRNSAQMFNELGIVIDDMKSKTDEWDKKLIEAQVATSSYNNMLALTVGKQLLFGEGLNKGTIAAGEFIANIVIGNGEMQGFSDEMVKLSDEGVELATQFVNIKKQYNLTNEEAKGFFETQQKGGDTLDYLAGIINKRAGPALEYYNDLLQAASKKEFKEKWKDKENELEKMGLDDDTIDTLKKNAKEKDNVFKAIRNMGRGVESISLIGKIESKDELKALDDITDTIIEDFESIQKKDSDLKGITGFPDYVKSVAESGDPEQMKNLQKIIDTVDMFWENDQDISAEEANIIKAMLGLKTGAEDAVTPTEDLTEAQKDLANQRMVKVTIDAQTGAFQLQKTYVDELNKSLALRAALIKMGGGGGGDTSSGIKFVSGADIFFSTPEQLKALEDKNKGIEYDPTFGKGDKKTETPKETPKGDTYTLVTNSMNVMAQAARGLSQDMFNLANSTKEDIAANNIVNKTINVVTKVLNVEGRAARGLSSDVLNLAQSTNEAIASNNLLNRTINTVTKVTNVEGRAVRGLSSDTGNVSDSTKEWIKSNNTANKTIQQVTKVSNLLGRAVRGLSKDVINLSKNMEDIPNIKRTITITTIHKEETRWVMHGGSFIRNAQHGMAGIIGRPTTMDGVRMGEHSKPELITVTPLTNPNNVADQTIKLQASKGGDSGSAHLLQKILSAIESLRFDANFKLDGNDIVRSKDIFATISPLMGKQLAKYG